MHFMRFQNYDIVKLWYIKSWWYVLLPNGRGTVLTYKIRMKKAQLLKFGNGYEMLSHILLGMCVPVHMGIKVNPYH